MNRYVKRKVEDNFDEMAWRRGKPWGVRRLTSEGDQFVKLPYKNPNVPQLAFTVG
jgi:hypothetical protein